MSLSRRQFLLGGLGAGAAGAAGLVIARQPWESQRQAGQTPGQVAAPAVPGKDGILILLTLYGGNDGLNTVIPYEAGPYLGGRSQLGYQPSEVLPLGEGLGLHPNLVGFKELWDKGQLAIVRGVGYPNPTRSHFRSMDIWQSAAPDANVATGWVGRWLDTTTAFGHAAGKSDPLRAISVGSTLPRIFGGEKVAGAAVPVGELTLPGGPAVADGFSALSVPSPGASPLAARVSQVGADLLHVHHSVSEMVAAHPEDEEANAASAGGLESNRNALDGQLALVARLIKAGSPTRVYGVNLNGFDTHVNEKETHARLLGELDEGVKGFFADLAGSPHASTAQASNVVLVAYSEFGRRVAANASGGTDHGTAAPVFVAGPSVKGGFYGDEPSLVDLDQGDLRFTTDFRSVYATVLQDVLGIEAKAVLGKTFTPVPFL